jgi:hypothetical protein
MFTKFSRLSLLLAGTACLSGCFIFQDIYGPSSLPRGYAHYDDTYKTKVPETPFFVEEYTKREALRSENLWVSGVHDLLNKLEQEAIIHDPHISIQPASPTTSLDIRFDYYLRQALRERGYILVADTPLSVPILRYKAYEIGETSLVPEYGYKKEDFISSELHAEDTHVFGRDASHAAITDVYLGVGVFDPAAPEDQQLLHYTEIKHPVLTKDLNEQLINASFPPVTGSKPPYKDGPGL